MKSNLPKPDLSRRETSELRLSGKSLVELMKAVLDKGCAFRFRARGWSMTPFIHDGDVITVSPIKGRKPGMGDVVAYTHPDSEKLVVHRLIQRQAGEWIILGDNNPDASYERVPACCLMGRVTDIERDGRTVRLGLGYERYLIASLSRIHFLTPLLVWIRQVKWIGRTTK